MQEPCCASWPDRQHTDHIYVSEAELHTPLLAAQNGAIYQHRVGRVDCRTLLGCLRGMTALCSVDLWKNRDARKQTACNHCD